MQKMAIRESGMYAGLQYCHRESIATVVASIRENDGSHESAGNLNLPDSKTGRFMDVLV